MSCERGPGTSWSSAAGPPPEMAGVRGVEQSVKLLGRVLGPCQDGKKYRPTGEMANPDGRSRLSWINEVHVGWEGPSLRGRIQ